MTAGKHKYPFIVLGTRERHVCESCCGVIPAGARARYRGGIGTRGYAHFEACSGTKSMHKGGLFFLERGYAQKLDPTNLKPGSEQHTMYYSRIKRRRYCQYDYRAENGELFSTIAETLEDARAKRDEWLKSKSVKRP